MSSKFEQLLDYLVNEETDKANELFHEIVVEKSREIYENLIAEEEEESVEEMSDDEDESVEEASEEDEDDESVDEGFGGEENEEEFPVQDQTDDFGGEIGDDDAMDAMGGDEFGSEEEGGTEPATKDDVMDLKSALEELQAEFEALIGAERNEEENEPGIHDDESGEDPLDDVDADADGEPDSEEDDEQAEAFSMRESRVNNGKKSQGETMREYIERVSVAMADGEGVGSGRGDKAGQTGGVIKHSPISSAKGKPETGANAKNIAQKGMGENQDGQSPHQPKNTGVLKRGDKFTSAGTHNVDGVKSGIKTVKAVPKPGNKEGAGVGAVAGGDKAGQTGGVQTRSPLTGAPHRNT